VLQGRQSRVVLLKAEDDHVGHLLVKTEPKQEPVESSSSYTSSLADLDGITDLLPIQTGHLHQCSGSITFGTDPDPYISPVDPDPDTNPAIFCSDLTDAKKK
jgi:hypothetical protein